jgi:hypothetical protein
MLAAANGLPPEQVEAIAPKLKALDEALAPLLAQLTPENEPAVKFQPAAGEGQ